MKALSFSTSSVFLHYAVQIFWGILTIWLWCSPIVQWYFLILRPAAPKQPMWWNPSQTRSTRTLWSIIADQQKFFYLNPYTIQLLCLWKSHHKCVRLLLTVREKSVFFQSIPQERATVICLRPFCLSEMFNFLAHNGSCTLGKQPLLACLFGRRDSSLIWQGFQMTTHTREMRG